MARLLRPYIPLDVRCQVAARQCEEKHGAGSHMRPSRRSARLWLCDILILIFGDKKVELHHRPALENRPFNKRTGKYKPEANDPDFLVYLEKHDHHIETHVRGICAQRSDTGQRNHQKALDRNRGKIKRRPKVKIRSRGFSGGKRLWPSRKFQTRKQWR